MSAVLNTLRELLPDFSEARQERNRIRKRYRDNLKALDRNDTVYTISSRDYSPKYLGNRTEGKLSHADHLIQKNGSQSSPHSYRIIDDEDEVKEAMNDVVKWINRMNYLSLFTEAILIGFTIICITLALYLGIAGIGSVASQIAGLEQASNTTGMI